MDPRKLLLKLNMDEVDCVPCRDQVIPARLKKVIDGDTLKVIIMLGEYPMEINIRILGIDAPETVLRRGVTELEKKAGLCVKKHVSSLIKCGKVYDIILKDFDKYSGRYLGDIYLKPNLCLSQYLLNKRLVRPYSGGAKVGWNENFLQNIINSKL